MADAVSIAGLTVAVLEQLIKVGKETLELVDNIRRFDEVCVDMACVGISRLIAARMSEYSGTRLMTSTLALSF